MVVRRSANADTQVLAELARHLVAASQTAAAATAQAARPPAATIARRDTAEIARARASWDRSMRIQAGHHARRLPYLATAATYGAGWGAFGIAELAEVAAGPAGHNGAVAGIVGLCAAASGVLRITYRHGIAPRWRARWWTAAAAASGWVSVAAATGPHTWSMTAALAAGATAIAAGWQRAHAVPNPSEQPAPAPAPVIETTDEADLGAILAERWADHIGAKDGPLPGAMLTGRTDLPNVIRWMVQTPPGKFSFDTLLGSLPRIAAGLRLGQAKVVLEPDSGDESVAWLSVLTRDELAEGVPYTGPRYFSESARDGRIPAGPHADGTGWADYAAVDGVGCRNGLVTGEPGSGKSAFLEVIALGLTASVRWTVLFGDGDPGGGSSPLLNRLAHWAGAGPDAALAQLTAIEELLELRTALKATLTAGPDGTPTPITDPRLQLPLRELLPSPAFPGVCWIIDELHRLTQDEWLKSQKFGERLEKIARIGRKYGIVMLAGTQSLLADDFGGNTKLRAYLAARNNFAFRNGNKSEQHVVAGLKIAPAALPTGGGYAFSTGTGRISMLRVAWARDLSPYLTELTDTTLDPDSDRILAAHRPPEAADPAVLYADAMAVLRAKRTGHTHHPAGPPPAAPQAPDHPHSRPDQLGNGPVQPGLDGVMIPAALTVHNVIPIRPRPTTVGGPVETGHHSEDTAAALSDTQRCVYDALNSLGWKQLVRTGQLADLTGLRPPSVSKALNVLVDRGLAVRKGHGEYQSAAVAAEAAAATSTNNPTHDDVGDELDGEVG